jgi:septal ring factor EnvC (AmiA/AmiB activator)
LKAEKEAAEKKLEESKAEIAAKTKLVESKTEDLKRLEGRANREKVLSELLSPLDKSKREVMNQLLESVQTGNLRGAYDRYLPAVLNSRQQPVVKGRETLKESTGDKNVKVVPIDETDLSEIKRLAGLQ